MTGLGIIIGCLILADAVKEIVRLYERRAEEELREIMRDEIEAATGARR